MNRVQHLTERVLCPLGQVGVDHSRIQALVPEQLLDRAHIDAGFQQMRGVGMPQGVHRGVFGNAALTHSGAKRPLQVRGVDRSSGYPSRENPLLRSVLSEEHAQQRPGRLGQRNVPVLGALAVSHPHLPTLQIDVGARQMHALVQAQPQRVDQLQRGSIDLIADQRHNMAHFLDAEHHRQSTRPRRALDAQHPPGSLERFFVEEFDPRKIDRERAGRGLPLVDQMQEECADLLVAEQIG